MTKISLEEFLTHELGKENYLVQSLDDAKDRMRVAEYLSKAFRENWSKIRV